MFCSTCGYEVANEAAFCAQCGAPVDSLTHSASSPPATPSQKAATPSASNKPTDLADLVTTDLGALPINCIPSAELGHQTALS